MNRLAELFDRVDCLLVRTGNTVLLALMLLVTADVFLRYFIGKPLVWAHDVVSLYLLPAVFFLMLSDSFREGAQVRVDILRDHLPTRLRAFTDAIGHLATLVAVVLIGIGAGWQLLEAWRAEEVVAGSIPWPVWPSFLLVVLGSAMLALRLAAACVGETGPGAGAAGRTDTAEAGETAE